MYLAYQHFHVLFAKGPKLFKEPSSKSNKPIIINAIAHCCLAGKVNESQKNAVLEASVPVKIYCGDYCCCYCFQFSLVLPHNTEMMF